MSYLDILSEIDNILLKKAKELNLYVDFSEKTYDGDKEAPMDRFGLLDYLINQRVEDAFNAGNKLEVEGNLHYGLRYNDYQDWKNNPNKQQQP